MVDLWTLLSNTSSRTESLLDQLTHTPQEPESPDNAKPHKLSQSLTQFPHTLTLPLDQPLDYSQLLTNNQYLLLLMPPTGNSTPVESSPTVLPA